MRRSRRAMAKRFASRRCAGTDPNVTRLDYGPCCACGSVGRSVRNVLMLPRRASVPGTGWGCFACGLPCDGALTVLCDNCLGQREPTEAVAGYITGHGRIPIADLTEPFDHDLSKHRELGNAD